MKRVPGWIFLAGASVVTAQAQSYSMADYKAQPGLQAQVADKILTITWEGEKSDELRMRLAVEKGAPIIREIGLRRKGSNWSTLATNLTPEFEVVSGLRRMTDQQLQPLKALGVPITPAILDQDRWEAFWDAPLRVPGNEEAHHGATPPAAGIADQPGLPRKPSEIRRASASFDVQSCSVRTDGVRLEVLFPGVQLGIFSGGLQYTVYKGSNLIRQEIAARTQERAAAYKYDAGVRGIAIGPDSRVVWRDTANSWQNREFGGVINKKAVTLQAAELCLRLQGAEQVGLHGVNYKHALM